MTEADGAEERRIDAAMAERAGGVLPEGTRQVTVVIDLSRDFLSDVLTTAFDADYGGCWYWAAPRIHGTRPLSAWNIDGEVWIAVTIVEREASGEKRKWCVVDHGRIVKGIERLFSRGCLPGRNDIRNAILKGDAGDIDANAADVIVQLGMFGELVYG